MDPVIPRRMLASPQPQVQVSPINICAKGIAAFTRKGQAFIANMMQRVP